MRKGNAVVVVLLVVVVLAIGGYFAYKMMKNNGSTAMSTTASPESSSTSALSSPYPAASAVGTGSSLAPGTANTNLDQDLQTVNGKMNTAVSAGSDVDTSVQGQSADTPTGVQ